MPPMSAYIVTVTMKFRVVAPTKREAEEKMQDRVNAPEDNPPGQLEYWKVSAREVGT